jgi:hypothetical protein
VIPIAALCERREIDSISAVVDRRYTEAVNTLILFVAATEEGIIRVVSASLDMTKRPLRASASLPALSSQLSAPAPRSELPALYMCSITLSPNCEHLISVAPSINRAKSYVTRLLAIAPVNPLIIRSATSVHPM